MSTLGGRLGFAARRQFSSEAAQLTAVYGIATCAADGIRQAIGNAPLAVQDAGEHRLTLADQDSGACVQVTLRPAVLAMAAAYRQQVEELDMVRGRLSPNEAGAWQARLEVLLDGLLERLRTMPDEELLTICSGTADE